MPFMKPVTTNAKISTKRRSAESGVAALRAFLLPISTDEKWPLLEPLPVTRDLGRRFGISNVSAFRVLAEFRERGLFWQAENGRYYRSGARRLIEKPKPVACLLRQLQAWTEVGREILQGADEACGAMDRAILLVHDRALYEQANPTGPTTTGSKEILSESLEDFLLLHGERTAGVLLDELWPDEVLADFGGRLRGGVMLYRQTKLPFLGSVSADCSAAAKLVVELVKSRGDREMVLVPPASEYLPSKEMALAVKRAAKTHGISCREATDFSRGFSKDVQTIISGNSKTLLVATEDNLALEVLGWMKQLGWTNPSQAGLVSTMGTGIALNAGITSASFDFREMGRQAAKLATASRPERRKIAPVLSEGSTT